MRFALLGDHEDGLAMARAVAESGRHELLCYSGAGIGLEYLRRWNLNVEAVADLEEVLANPAIDALIIAGSAANRATQLRRALQSERHVLCVHPIDQKPDLAFEAASLQRETNCVLMPLLPEAIHPGIERLAKLIAQDRAQASGKSEKFSEQPIASQRERSLHSDRDIQIPSVPRLIQLELWSTDAVLHDADSIGYLPGIPGWDVLRRLAGEILEVIAFADLDQVPSEDPILLAGRFEKGGLFQTVLVPHQPVSRWRLTVLREYDQAELVFPDGSGGPARLTWQDEDGEEQQEKWDEWNPWPRLVELFEQTVADLQQHQPQADKHFIKETSISSTAITWEDEERCLELDDAARRSLERRRSSTLEYQEDYEEASFKGTMTLMGCGLLWASLALLILSRWVHWLGWLIAPLFGVFLVMQLLRWVIPPKHIEAPPSPENSDRQL